MGEGERYIPKAVRKGEAFLSTEEKDKAVESWKVFAAKNEPASGDTPLDKPFNYRVYRVESDEIPDSIAGRHEESFINETIPRLIEENPNRKIKILDIGGGIGMFAKQIRESFGDKVEVFTTGLKKKAVKKEMERVGESIKLNKNDLKWRSVLELHDFPEFDLMIDTAGEALYSLSFKKGATLDDAAKYFNAVASKLLPGGHASIEYVGKIAHGAEEKMDMFAGLEKKCGVKIIFIEHDDKNSVVKIDKPKEKESE